MAVFNNIETLFPNHFLNNGGDNNDITGHYANCFCGRCRAKMVAEINDRYRINLDDARKVAELRYLLLEVLPVELQDAKDKVFEVTKRMIVHGTIYQEACLKGTDYVQFRSWAKLQPFYEQYVKGNSRHQREFERHCKLVNDCAYVYRKWETIVSNLQDERLKFLDARGFTIAKFREAHKMSWCISENERARNGSAPQRKGEQLWTPDDVSNAAQHLST